MPVWHQQKYGLHKWGYLGPNAPQTSYRAILSNNHPWFTALGLQNYWRDAEFQVWRVDAATLANVDQLPHIAGGLRTSKWEDVPFQTETLALTFLNPAEYLAGGIYVDRIPLNQLLRLRWLVRAQAGTLTLDTGLYRVVTLPSVTVDGRSSTQEPTVQCEDWLAQPLRQLLLDGGNPLGNAVAIRDQALPQGCPVVWSADSYATLIAALVWTAAGQRLRVPEPWRTLYYWGTSNPLPTEPPPPAPPPPEPPGPTSPYVTVGVGPNTTNRGTLTHFDVNWSYVLTDMTPDDAIVVTSDTLDAASASAEAAGLPAGDPRVLPTYGSNPNGLGADLTLDFGVGHGAYFWYWHRVRGCLDTPGHVALL